MFALTALLACVAVVSAVPTNFDARTQWPGCANFILNQEQCGSCWDFCSVESFADRMCITGEVASGTIISPEPILDCSLEGCGGGNPSVAWKWMLNNGDTSCTKQCFSGCQPYDSGAGTSPKCHKGTCDSGSNWPVTYFAGSFQSLAKGDITKFQTELETYGPLQACYTVYNNFYTYFDSHPTGIYTSASGSVVGGHCVKMIGWGVSGGTNYWLFANSWDTTWGDQGYFKMERGTNLCGIEDQISEGFTLKQASLRGVYGIDPAYNTSFIVGGWYNQEDFTVEFVNDAINAAVNLLSDKVGRELVLENVLKVETQVVAGVNFKMSLVMEGKAVEVKLFRDLKYQYHLRI